MTTRKRSRRSFAHYLHLPTLILSLVRRLGPKAVLLWALLVLVMASVASGLANLVSGLQAGYLFLTAALAITLAWSTASLGASMRAGLAAAISMLLGMTFLLVRVGGLSGDLLLAARAALKLLVEIMAWPWLGPPQLATLLAPLAALSGVWGDMAVLLMRPLTWLWAIVHRRGVFDPVASTLTWGLAMWLGGSWAGWVARRHIRPLLAVAPGGALVAFLLAYTGAKSAILLPIIGLTLILMALMRQWSRERRWERQNIDYSRALWQDMMVIALLVAAATVSVAAIAPALSIDKFVRWVREYTRDEGQRQVSESMGLEMDPEPEKAAPSPMDSARRTDLPREHLIGSGPELSEDVVMIIRTGAPARAIVPDLQLLAPRYYWRSITYDVYLGGGWRTSGTERVKYEMGEHATRLAMPHLRRVRQEVEMVDDTHQLIYVAGTLMAVDKPYEVSWRPPGEIFAATLSEAAASEDDEPAWGYRADSAIPIVAAEELRADDGIYPDWILDRYLQLPESTPERLLVLARDLTATEPTPYDRARAIEQYLRQFPYTLDVSYAPPGRDIADFFIFDLQEGYCDYYATAMVVLARAAGLPARLVVGYASGSYDAETASYIVTEADAHAWVELYFPTHGWIEFEPTAAFEVLDHASEMDEAHWPEDEEIEPLVPRLDEGIDFRPGRWLLRALLLFVGGGLVASVIDMLWLLTLSPPARMRRLYRRLRRYGRRFHVYVPPGATPHEFQAAFMRPLEAYPQDVGPRKLLDSIGEGIALLIERYIQVFYTPVVLDDARGIAIAWWRLRWRLILYWIWRELYRRRFLIAPGPPPARPEELPRRPLSGV